MRIVETMHEKQTYWLVFDDKNNVVYKTAKYENASNFIHTTHRTEESY